MKEYPFLSRASSFAGRAVVFFFVLSALLCFFYALGNYQDFLDSTQLFLLRLLRVSLEIELFCGVWLAVFLVYRNVTRASTLHCALDPACSLPGLLHRAAGCPAFHAAMAAILKTGYTLRHGPLQFRDSPRGALRRRCARQARRSRGGLREAHPRPLRQRLVRGLAMESADCARRSRTTPLNGSPSGRPSRARGPWKRPAPPPPALLRTVIVAVGGGSVLDTAKALSALLRAPEPVDRYLEGTEGALAVPGSRDPMGRHPDDRGDRGGGHQERGGQVGRRWASSEACALRSSWRAPSSWTRGWRSRFRSRKQARRASMRSRSSWKRT